MAFYHVLVVLLIMSAVACAVPTLTFAASPYFNLALSICVNYNATDGFDGRDPETKASGMSAPDAVSHETHPFTADWVGLYRAGTCKNQDNIIGQHQCHLAYRTIPRPTQDVRSWSGEICFNLDEYREAGNYDIRYFYGGDPVIDYNCSSPEYAGTEYGCSSTHFHWDGQGYICNTNAGISGSVAVNYGTGSGCADIIPNGELKWTSALATYDCGQYEPNNPQSTGGVLFSTTECAAWDCDKWAEYDALYDYFSVHGSKAANAAFGYTPVEACCASGTGGTRWTHDCNCDPTAGTDAEIDACKQVAAACQRCALEPVAEAEAFVLESMGIGPTQQSAHLAVPGFEFFVN